MTLPEFDEFADEYRMLHAASIRASGESPEYFARYKVQDVAAICAASGLAIRRVLDFGAGIGGSVPFWREYCPTAALECLDVSERSLARGRERHGSAATFRHFDGVQLPFPDGMFQVAFAACVFHHIAAEQHIPLLTELRRVLAPEGQLFLFEHNPYNPLTIRAVNSCPFDEHAVLIPAHVMSKRLRLAGFHHVRTAYRIFFPAAFAPLRALDRFLTRVPVGAQYRLVAQP